MELPELISEEREGSRKGSDGSSLGASGGGGSGQGDGSTGRVGADLKSGAPPSPKFSGGLQQQGPKTRTHRQKNKKKANSVCTFYCHLFALD